MKLVDTSSWIEQLRRGGNTTVRTRVEELLAAGEAAWCSIVRLELWNGAKGGSEQAVLREMETEIPSLEITPPVWDRAVKLASAARGKGVTVPTTDLLVAACARQHGVAIEHCDSHFDLIGSL
jgi:predicted nucleic acid-binding protein